MAHPTTITEQAAVRTTVTVSMTAAGVQRGTTEKTAIFMREAIVTKMDGKPVTTNAGTIIPAPIITKTAKMTAAALPKATGVKTAINTTATAVTKMDGKRGIGHAVTIRQTTTARGKRMDAAQATEDGKKTVTNTVTTPVTEMDGTKDTIVAGDVKDG
jgi:hypothetical protein